VRRFGGFILAALLISSGCGHSADEAGGKTGRGSTTTTLVSPFNPNPTPTATPLPPSSNNSLDLETVGGTALTSFSGPYELSLAIGSPVVIGREASSRGNAVITGDVEAAE